MTKATPCTTTTPADDTRPTIVTLCGSTRSWSALAEANARETLTGKMVFAPADIDTASRHRCSNPEEAARIKETLAALHLAKIRAADEVLIVNEHGYIGDSTLREIRYALDLGKPVRYTETYEHAVLITRPGLADIRLGPLRRPHQTERVVTSLTGQLHHTAHVPGTTITSVPYDPTQPHRGLPLTTDPYALARTMDDTNGSGAHRHDDAFPDAYALLAACHGPDLAAELWTTASEIHDHLHTGPMDEGH